MTHFLLYLKAVMPGAEWGHHNDITIAALPSGEKFLIAPLSAWPVVQAVNKVRPFPTPITPILYGDVPLSGVHPKGRWLLGTGRGLIWYRDERWIKRTNHDTAPPKREKCGEPECDECFILEAFQAWYSVPV